MNTTLSSWPGYSYLMKVICDIPSMRKMHIWCGREHCHLILHLYLAYLGNQSAHQAHHQKLVIAILFKYSFQIVSDRSWHLDQSECSAGVKCVFGGSSLKFQKPKHSFLKITSQGSHRLGRLKLHEVSFSEAFLLRIIAQINWPKFNQDPSVASVKATLVD